MPVRSICRTADQQVGWERLRYFLPAYSLLWQNFSGIIITFEDYHIYQMISFRALALLGSSPCFLAFNRYNFFLLLLFSGASPFVCFLSPANHSVSRPFLKKLSSFKPSECTLLPARPVSDTESVWTITNIFNWEDRGAEYYHS